MGVTTVVVGVLLLVICACLGYLAVRRVRLMRGGGVDVCLRRRPVSASAPRDVTAGWHFGVARYRGNELAWYRLTSLRPGATLVLHRTELAGVERRAPLDTEIDALPHAAAILRYRADGADVELAMAAGVLTGFLAWLESAPPSSPYRRAS